MNQPTPAQRSATRVVTDRQLLARFVRRNWWIVLASVLLALLAAGLFLVVRREMYSGSAVLLIQPQGTQGDGREAQPATPELVRSQLEVIRSQDVLNKVVRQLGLDREPSFVGDSPAQLRSAAARDELRERLEVENDGRSYIISLAARAREPEQAAEIANAVARTYIAHQREQKVQVVESTRKNLGQRLAALRDETVAAEQEAERYRQEVGLVPLSSIPEDSESYAAATPASREIIEMSRERSALAARRAEATARLRAQRQAIAAGRGEATGEVLSSSVVSSLRAQEAELASRESELLARYSSSHPLVRPVQAQLAEVRRALRSEIARIHASVASNAAASAQALAGGDDVMSRLKQERSRDLAASTRLSQLQREARLRRATYEEFASQMQRVSERAGLQLPDVLLVSAASPPIRSNASPAPLVLVGAGFVGLIAGVVLGALRSFLALRRHPKLTDG